MYIIIVGAGKLGFRLSQMFSVKENNVALVDTDEAALTRAHASIDLLTIHANGLDFEKLAALNIAQADVLIATTGEDETNLLLATMAKKAGCKKVIARIRKPEYAAQTGFFRTHLDINYFPNPDFEIAKEILEKVNRRLAVNHEDFARGKIALSESRLDPRSELIGKPIKDLVLPKKLIIVALVQQGKIIIPNGNTVLHPQDTVYALGVHEEIHQFCKRHGKAIDTTDVRRMMLLGGGKSAYYLAKMLLEHKIDVKIIERSKERCKELAQLLPSAMVIHGDATDTSLLEDEKLNENDAVALITGFDEDNILLSMIAKQQGVPKIITKLSKTHYLSLTDTLGIDEVVNPVHVTAAGIFRYVRGGQILSISSLLGGEAEVLEIIATHDTPIVNHALKDIDFPDGIIIGAIIKKGKVYIPNGNMEVHPGDRMIIFAIADKTKDFDSYFYPKSKGSLLRPLKDLFS